MIYMEILYEIYSCIKYGIHSQKIERYGLLMLYESMYVGCIGILYAIDDVNNIHDVVLFTIY